MPNQNIQELSEAAFKYGPFFFSILFVIFLTRWAYKKYSIAVSQVPALSPQDLKINRTMFLSTFFFGIMLVVVSIVWWWWFKPSVNLFIGKIQNLQPQEEVAADVYYLKRQSRAPLSDEDVVGQLRNEEFVIISPRPFRKGQTFELDYSKNHQRRTKLWITYEATDDEPVYEVEYDEASRRPFLKPVVEEKAQEPHSTSDWLFERRVFAAAPAQKDSSKTELISEDRDAIKLLQDPRSDVATKLNALDKLSSRPHDVLRKFLELDLAEPFALTIFDLTQHTDQELADAASSLAQVIDIDGYLVSELASQDRSRRQNAERILLRISRPHAQAILRKTDIGKYEDLSSTANDVESGKKTQILKPTASTDGDRYYVRATWNPNDQKTIACLTSLFNSALVTTRTPAQEDALMRGKSQRFVFWYSKAWAIHIADETVKCGGKAEFVKAY
jgi:hypothetical protein